MEARKGTQTSGTVRCIIYARTSADDPNAAGNKTSIPDQIAELTALAERKGYEVAATLSDPDRSGRTWWTGAPLAQHDRAYQDYCREHIQQSKRRTRDGLAELVKLLPTINVILVREVDRLMRPLPTSFLQPELLQLLRQHNVSIETPAKTFGPNDFGDHLVMTLDGLIQDHSMKARNREQRIANATRKDKGLLASGGTPFGYKCVGRQQVEIVPDEAEAVKDVFKWYISGVSRSQIAHRLNKRLPCKRGGNMWESNRIACILRRSYYAGLQTDSKGDFIPSQVYKDKALVSVTDWRRARQLLTQNKRAHIGKGEDHVLSGLVYCGSCGRRCYHKKMNGITYWLCRGVDLKAAYVTPDCRPGMIRGTSPDTLAPKHYVPTVGLESALKPLTGIALWRRMQIASQRPEFEAKQVELQEAIGDIDARIDTLSQMFGKRELDARTFQQTVAELRAERAEKRTELDSIEGNLATSDSGQPTAKDFVAYLKSVDHSATRPQLWRESISRVDLFPDRVKVTLPDGGEFELPRIKYMGGRSLPSPWRVEYKDGKRHIIYRLKSSWLEKDTTRKTIYEDKALVVVFEGHN